MSTAALLMLKAPRPGVAKTRLAAGIGEEAACLAYRAMVERQVGEIPMGWAKVVHFAPADAFGEMNAWLGAPCSYFPQVEGDLGSRMSAALTKAWKQGHSRAVLLGGDCPWITRELLLRAERELSSHDLVIGPATDGGYYLMALNAEIHPPFQAIEWSTSRVLAQTLEQIAECGFRACLLPELEDVDDAEAWARARVLFESGL